ncbi:phospho-N-acetylmuramoyl-pentapeptide-transferase [Candidatus Jidaibacter acanthamoebae]|nr:phospho-N-acetylmuramoyl-pentapeptide-transferase [Candidatus Jidaibacter acanthamoeba]
MLYYLANLLINYYPMLNVFKYLTFRSGGAIATALLVSFLLGNKIINWLKSIQEGGQPIRTDGPESHLITKKGTPTMGGVLIILSITFSVLLWADLSNPYIWVTLFITISYGVLGFLDDYLKIKYKNSKGVSGKIKLFWQFSLALIAGIMVSYIAEPQHVRLLTFPFFKHLVSDLGWFYFVFIAIVMTGASNAVNLTDGLDGLAIGPIMVVSACFALISYLAGNVNFANYLQIHYISHSGELAVFCAAMIGAGLGFLWYNAPPAQVFMGDVGSLSLGGAIGVISVITKHEIVLFITGGLFVIEAISVILQVGSFKLRGKRIFKMAPIHHHYEKLGWPETKIVMRFWIISIIFALIGLSTLKLR